MQAAGAPGPRAVVHAQLGDEDGLDARLGGGGAPRVHGRVPEAAARQLDRREGRQPGGQHPAVLEDLGRVCQVALDQRVGREDAGQARAAGEGAAEAAAVDGGEGRRQDEGLEARAGVEGTLADGLQALGEVEVGDASAPVECVVADGR